MELNLGLPPPLSHSRPAFRSAHKSGSAHCGSGLETSGFAPRLVRHHVSPPVTVITPSRSAASPSMTAGAQVRRYESFGLYFHQATGRLPPPPKIIPWSRSWRITAPKFLDDDAAEAPAYETSIVHTTTPPRETHPRVFQSFGEFTCANLHLPSPKPTVHVFWEEKTPTATVSSPSSQSEMAFRFVDPAPFMPLGAQRMIVDDRPLMCRVVIGHVAQRNNDVAIAVLDPMPFGPINFMAIHNILEDFLHQHNVGFRSMQPCPFGQAYIRFNYIFERDLLIQNSPHQHGNGSITFLPHDRAWNNRTALMTHEVWIMMLGLNLDLWTQPLIDKVVSSFGRLMIWEEDHFFMSRAVVKVRVSNLEDIPWFFVFTEGVGFESNSWSVQCKILQATMLGAGPGDEHFPPDDGDFDPQNFHFHGFGQPGNGPPPSPPINPIPQANLEALHAMGWDAWPANQNDQAFQDEQIAPNLIPIHQNDPQEEVVQAEGFVMEPPVPAINEQVLAMDDLTESSEEEPVMPPLMDDLADNVLDFPNLQNIPHFQVEEVQIEDMIGYADRLNNQQNQLDGLAPNQQDQHMEGFENIQLGFVHTFVPPSGPCASDDWFS